MWIILGVNSVAFENQGNSVSCLERQIRSVYHVKRQLKGSLFISKRDGRGFPVLFISAREFLQRVHPEMSKYLIAKRKKKSTCCIRHFHFSHDTPSLPPKILGKHCLLFLLGGL